MNLDKGVAWCPKRSGKELASSQQAALRQALSTRELIITGGSRVGKTTLVNAILAWSEPSCFPCRAAASG